MFVLLRRVRAWRAEMLLRGVLSPSEISELEDHLLEEAGRLGGDGRSDDEAFQEALRRVGTGDELQSEFVLEHTLSGTFGGAWVGRLWRWFLQACRVARLFALFLLPGFVIGLPGFVMACRFSDTLVAVPDWTRNLYYPRSPLFDAMAFVARNIWWLLPLLVVLFVLPTWHRVRLLRDRTDATFSSIWSEEMGAAAPVLMAGVMMYPLVGMAFLRVVFEPLFRMVSLLGG